MTQIIDVFIEELSAGGFVAMSSNMKGLYVWARERETLEEKIRETIAATYQSSRLDVIVSKVEGAGAKDASSWVAVPANIASTELNKLNVDIESAAKRPSWLDAGRQAGRSANISGESALLRRCYRAAR